MSDLYQFIGEKIKELRQKFLPKPLSQDDLARRMETTANTISRWESATYKPSAKDLQKLAKIFGVDVAVFFPGAKAELNPLGALMSALGDLGPKDIDEITQYAQFRRARQELAAAKAKPQKKAKK